MTTVRTSPRKPHRMFSLSFAMALGLVGVAGVFMPRPAQAIVCANCSTWVADLIEYGQKLVRWADDAAKWQQQIQGMQNQIAQIQNMFLSLGIQPGPQMNEVPQNYMVAERCGGITMSSLTQVLNVNGSGDIYQQQKQVCASIQAMQNTKYNETVRFLRDSSTQMQQDFTRLQQQYARATNLGNNTKASQDADAVMTKQKMRFDDWETRMKAYDAYIATMQNQQRLLAQIALKGSRTNQALGQIGRTVILEQALD